MLSSPPPGPGEDADVHVYVGITTSTRIVKPTTQWLDTFGLEVKECLGRTLYCLVGPETDMGKINEIIGAVREGNVHSLHMVLHTAQGEKALYAVKGKQVRGALDVPPVCRLNNVKDLHSAVQVGHCRLRRVQPHR